MADPSPEFRAKLDELCAKDDVEAPIPSERQLARLRELLVPRVPRPTSDDNTA